jgi:hypothetical protein
VVRMCVCCFCYLCGKTSLGVVPTIPNSQVFPPSPGIWPPLTTTWKCQRVGPYADVCVYENLCHDGEFWYFIDPDAYKKNKTLDPVLYPYSDFKTGVVYPRLPVPKQDSNQMFPFNGGGA